MHKKQIQNAQKTNTTCTKNKYNMYKKQIQHAQKTNTTCTKNKYNMHKKTNTKIKTIFIGFILFKNFYVCELRVARCVSSARKYEVFM